jgi:alanyl-tRNA synthetase
VTDRPVSDRLYYNDSYLTQFRANVIDVGPDRTHIYLDRTAFYPASGGQPADRGTLSGISVVDVVDEESRILHLLAEPLDSTAVDVEGTIDWTRRFDHMQQHSGQHLLSAVILEMFDIPTVSFHLGTEVCTIDVAAPKLETAQLQAVEQRANALVFENRPLTVEYGDSTQDLGLRKATQREGEIRVVNIAGVDRSACGGTHVRASGEIGPILLSKLDKIRGNVRIEFMCGMRAVRQARDNFDRLIAVAQVFSAPLEEVPALVLSQAAKLQESEKLRKRLAEDLAKSRGRQRYLDTIPDAAGQRRVLLRLPALTDELRTEAQCFTAGEKAVFLAVGENPPSILLATSKDSGIAAGERLKVLLAAAGGRGGGTATLAQGSVPSAKELENIVHILSGL